VRKLRIRRDGTQVGEHSQRLAEAQQPLLGANGRGGIVPLRSADSAQQHRIGASTNGDRIRRKRRSRGVDRRTADERIVEDE
jgi:hypothetical protein